MSRARGGLLVLALALTVVAPSAGASTPRLGGTWRGTFSLTRALPFSVQVAGKTATVTLPAGHPAPVGVAAHIAGNRLRFALPGRPTTLAFDGRLRAGKLTGTVTQAGVHGTFALRRGKALDTGGLGVYRLDSGHVVSVTQPGDLPLLVDYDADEIHGLFGDRVGAALGVRDPAAGSVRFTRNAIDLSLNGAMSRGVRVATRELEVRFRSGGTTLAGTLTTPATAGTHPAVAMIHGSGATPRTDGGVFTAYFASRGFVVLTYDKRGIGQSGGRWPGEAATSANIETYARDAQAAARLLAAQPQVDRTRVGLAGASQAGWIMPLAASREPAVKFLVHVSGPTVTQGEQQTYQDLTTEGATTPRETPAEILAAVRQAGPSGFDPLPSIRKLTVPALWLSGEIDQHVPTALCVERLSPIAAEPGRDFTLDVFPGADHFLIESAHGLTSEALRSNRYARGLFRTVDGWLRARSLTAG
jgi:dienelactone hydrolase